MSHTFFMQLWGSLLRWGWRAGRILLYRNVVQVTIEFLLGERFVDGLDFLPFPGGMGRKFRRALHDARREENQQLLLLITGDLVFKQQAHQRDIAENRHLLLSLDLQGLHQPADDNGLAV